MTCQPTITVTPAERLLASIEGCLRTSVAGTRLTCRGTPLDRSVVFPKYLTSQSHSVEDLVLCVEHAPDGLFVCIDVCNVEDSIYSAYNRRSVAWRQGKGSKNSRNGVKNPKLPIEKLRTGGTFPGRAYKLETCKIVPSPPNVMIKSSSSLSGLAHIRTPVLGETVESRSMIATPLSPEDSSGAASDSMRMFRLG
jgi:hypothetical protein